MGAWDMNKEARANWERYLVRSDYMLTRLFPDRDKETIILAYLLMRQDGIIKDRSSYVGSPLNDEGNPI